jgi:hypothetical protein
MARILSAWFFQPGVFLYTSTAAAGTEMIVEGLDHESHSLPVRDDQFV